MRQLATAGLIAASATLVAGLLGWIRTKGLAVVLGPDSFGLYGQAWTFSLTAGTVAALGLGIGTTTIVASARESDDRDSLGTALALVCAIPLVIGALFVALTITMGSVVAEKILDSPDVTLMYLAAASVPFVALQLPLQHLLQGFEDVKGQAVSYTLYSATFTVAAVGGAVLFDVEGALIGLAVGNAILVILYLIRSRSLLGRSGVAFGRSLAVLRSPAARMLGKRLIGIGSAALAVTVAIAAAELAIRSSLLHDAGPASAGIWHALSIISVQLIGPLAGAMSYITAPLLARAATRSDRPEIRRVHDDALRLGLVAVVPVIVLITLFRETFVRVAFDTDFLPMADYIPLLMTGDLLRTLAWMLGAGLVAVHMTRSWAAIGVGSSALYGALGSSWARSGGVEGVTFAYTLTWAVSAAAVVLVLLRRGFWRPTGRSVVGLGMSAIALSTAWAIEGRFGLALVAPELALLALLVLRPSERLALLRFAQHPLGSRASA